MELLTSKEELTDWLASKYDRKRVLVPTMGALHDGHASLFDLAREFARGGDVLGTIFVNPTQFGPDEDFDAYPRKLDEDLALCREHGVSAVFAPERSELYESDASVTVHETRLSSRLCGASRPIHFDGVCTIVTKLFLLTRPDAAVFGEKDYQQLAIIRRLVRDLDFPIEIIPGPTVRETDDLAMSSRNAYLTPGEREQAPILYQALSQAADAIGRGEIADPEEARKSISARIESAPDALIDYVEIVDADTLESLESFDSGSVRLLVAVCFGKTRLIDNVAASRFNGGTHPGTTS